MSPPFDGLERHRENRRVAAAKPPKRPQKQAAASKYATHTDAFRWRTVRLSVESLDLSQLARSGDESDGPEAVPQPERLMAAARVVDALRHALQESDDDLLGDLEKAARRAMKGTQAGQLHPWLATSEADREANFMVNMERLQAAAERHIGAGTIHEAASRLEFIDDAATYTHVVQFPGLSGDRYDNRAKLEAAFPSESWPPAVLHSSAGEIARHVLRALGMPESRVKKLGKGLSKRATRRVTKRRATK